MLHYHIKGLDTTTHPKLTTLNYNVAVGQRYRILAVPSGLQSRTVDTNRWIAQVFVMLRNSLGAALAIAIGVTGPSQMTPLGAADLEVPWILDSISNYRSFLP